MGGPASHRISRVRRYSRSWITPPPAPRLRDSHPLRSPLPVSVPRGARDAGEESATSSIHPVQPLPSSGGSLVRWSGLGSSRFARRYYGNHLCSSGYVRCFSSPGSLHLRGVRYDLGRVAPFGDLWITGSQRLPRAFRRVGASFIGLWRLGIHPVLIFGSCPRLVTLVTPAGRFLFLAIVVRAVTPVASRTRSPPQAGPRCVVQGAA